MSSTLTIEPSCRKKTGLSYELKLALQKKFEGTVFHKLIDESDISYFKGLLDAGIEDAQIVLDFLEKYGEVILNE
jgi:hypothetical protein